MSKWNAFQSANAGQGYSSSQMSAMYHASNSSSGSGPGSSSSYSGGGGSSSYSGGGGGYSSSSSSRPSYASPARTSPAPAPAPARSAWNAYQQAHAGQGLSRAEISAGYQASRSSSSGSSGSQAPSAASRTASASASPPVSASRPVSATSSPPSSSAWNTYQKTHAGKGLSRAELSEGYHASKNASSAAASPATTTTKASARATSGRATTVSAWNEFQRQHAGQGHTKRQLSLLYKQATSAAAESPSTARAKTTSGDAKPPRRANAFNEFQKQYKKDHPDEKLHAAELAKLYREQQQRRAEMEPKAPDAPLAERLCRQIEEMLVNMARMQQEPDMPMAERDEWRSVAQQLERDEGNYNRQSFVDAHGETPEWGPEDVDALDECELIDSQRIELQDEQRLGSGDCSTVYSAMVDGVVPVAVKVIDGVSTKSKRRFEQELLAMMKASSHANVLRVFGYTVFHNENESGSSGARTSYGIVMELMGGGDLAFVMHRDETVGLSLSEQDRLQVLLQVIKAIEFIHSQGITHRDIKPHNVLLSLDRKTAKLADFGLSGFKNTTLSTQQSATTTTTTAAMAVGLTPAYAAPEVIEGKLSSRDTAWKKSDVFSFTVLLAEVLLQEQPWEFETPQFIMNAVSKREERPFGETELSVFGGKSAAGNARLQSLVRDGWHQDPSMRPTAREMRKRLEKVVAAGKSVRAVGGSSTKSTTAARSRPASPRGVDGVYN